MFNKEDYIEELRIQLEYADSIEEYEDIQDTIRYLEDSLIENHEMEY